MGIDNSTEKLSIHKNKWRHLAGALAVVWMCIIFAFSAQTKEESSVVSEGFSYQIVSSTSFFFHLNLPDEQVREIARAIEGFVRKAAHMTEYAILSILLYVWIGYWDMIVWKRAVLSMIIASLYAASDEFHQLFVAGRSGRVIDVLIDSSGAVIGVVVVILFGRLAGALRRRKIRKARLAGQSSD